MRRSKKNIVYHELIGLEVMVKDHTSKSFVGMKGKVIDETMNTLVIMDSKGNRKVVPKLGGVFLFKLGDHHTVEVKGDRIMGRPEDRLKKYGGVM